MQHNLPEVVNRTPEPVSAILFAQDYDCPPVDTCADAEGGATLPPVRPPDWIDTNYDGPALNDYPYVPDMRFPSFHSLRTLCDLAWDQVAATRDPLQGFLALLDYRGLEKFKQRCPRGFCHAYEDMLFFWVENRIDEASPDMIVREEHPELYFTNGDIVLQAKIHSDTDSSPTLQMYCVHRAILSFHSGFFSTLFADGSALHEPSYNGRPLVEMHDDADDLSHLLLYVYKPSEYLLRPSHPDTPIELRGAVRLASKYMFDNARADMIKRVTMDWPVTLDQWDIREGERQSLIRVAYGEQYGNHRDGRRNLAEHTPEPVAAIVFAQEHGCSEIPPAAFYRLASLNIRNDWEDKHVFADPDRARWSLCDKENLVRYIQGREALEEYHHTVAQQLTDGDMMNTSCIPEYMHDTGAIRPGDPFEGKIKKYRCMHFIWTLRDIVWGWRVSLDPLTALAKLEDCGKLDRMKAACPYGLCETCEGYLRQWIHNERVGLWKNLPSYFQLK
ncbi:hypothetical protein TRAPUB_6159 [Trametes pubescens]|uniref:BTB domain-containing protein n=1 Tax=Trametes pubescens TaxID=154538 RepID=A0A1M2V6P4_TRAPU|nr:hypothetical protein TRAPUB_6159 [Trametes pubescens]